MDVFPVNNKRCNGVVEVEVVFALFCFTNFFPSRSVFLSFFVICLFVTLRLLFRKLWCCFDL